MIPSQGQTEALASLAMSRRLTRSEVVDAIEDFSWRQSFFHVRSLGSEIVHASDFRSWRCRPVVRKPLVDRPFGAISTNVERFDSFIRNEGIDQHVTVFGALAG